MVKMCWKKIDWMLGFDGLFPIYLIDDSIFILKGFSTRTIIINIILSLETSNIATPEINFNTAFL